MKTVIKTLYHNCCYLKLFRAVRDYIASGRQGLQSFRTITTSMRIFRTILSHVSVKWDFHERNLKNYNNCTHATLNYYNISILASFIRSFWCLYHVDEGIGFSEPGCKYLLYAFGLSSFVQQGYPYFICCTRYANPKVPVWKKKYWIQYLFCEFPILYREKSIRFNTYQYFFFHMGYNNI